MTDSRHTFWRSPILYTVGFGNLFGAVVTFTYFTFFEPHEHGNTVTTGGHLAFFTVEAVMRRPLRPQHRELAQRVGLLVLITLMVFVFYNDIHRLVQG